MVELLALGGFNAVIVKSEVELLHNDLNLDTCLMVHRYVDRFRLFQLSHKVKQSFPNMKIVHITSIPPPENDLLYLMPPFDYSELLGSLKRI